MHLTRAFLPGFAAVASAALVLWAGSPASAASTNRADVPLLARTDVAVPSRQKVITFRSAMGKLWEDRTIWTRLFIVSDLTNAPISR